MACTIGPRGRVGLALVEVLVALGVLELVAVALLAALLAVQRLDGAARIRSATDLGRRDTVALEAASPACRTAPAATTVPLLLPSAPGRPALPITIRCGR